MQRKLFLVTLVVLGVVCSSLMVSANSSNTTQSAAACPVDVEAPQ